MNIFRSKPSSISNTTEENSVAASAFQSHWSQAVDRMQHESQDSEAALAVISNLGQMINLLRFERGEEQHQQESCKTFWIQNKCADQAIGWLLELKNKGLQLTREDDERLVVMLHSLCELVTRDSELLGSSGCWDGACSLASLLLSYSFGNEVINGETARYSFILLIKLASRYPSLEKSLSGENGYDYINLIISGLTACFAQLPTYCQATSEQMRPFIQQLKFVDDISHAAPQAAATALAECFKNAFLDTIIKPSLTQDEGSLRMHYRHDRFVTSVYEEEAMVTRYLEIISSLLTHPLLIRSLMKFIITLLPSTFLQRIDHSHTTVTVSTLSLFNVLLDFYCEDLWFDLILQHLLPQHHRMVLQRKKPISEIDFHDSSVRFLSLLPSSVVEVLGQDILIQHYVQYLNNESKRLSTIDALGFGCVSPYVPYTKENNESSTNPVKNPIYPHWKLKYDGTDDYSIPNSNGEGDKNLINKDSTNQAENPLCSTPISISTAPPNISPVVLNGDSSGDSNTSSILQPSEKLTSEILLSSSNNNKIDVDDNTVIVDKSSQRLDPLTFDVHGDTSEASIFANMSLHNQQQQQPDSDVHDMSSIGLSVQSYDSFGSETSSGQVPNRNGNFTVNSPMIQKENINYENCTNSRGAKKLSSLETNNSDGYSSFIESASSSKSFVAENRASFGPFLDTLLDLLANWTDLDLDVILMVTELLSLIAASRIPLVNSIFLDPSVVLQPSYLSFASLLNRIRTDLDQRLRNHQTIVLDVWNNISKESSGGGRGIRRPNSASSTNSSMSNSFDNDSLNSSLPFADSVTRKMFSGANLKAKLQSVFNVKSFNTSPQPALNDTQDILQPVGGQGYRYTNPNQSYQSPSQLQTANEQLKLMATRAIFFSHWMLELAAVSQQLCWKRI